MYIPPWWSEWPSRLTAATCSAAAYAALTEALRLAQAIGPRLMVAAALEGLAGIPAQRGEAALAARLLTAASTLRGQMGTPMRPVDQAAGQQILTTARSTLGDDAFAAVWAEAVALPLEQILSTISSEAFGSTCKRGAVYRLSYGEDAESE